MEKLKLGIVTNAELASWFGISAKSLSNRKKRKLEELKEYARFEELKNKGKINIIEIYEDTYVNTRDKAFKIILDNIDKEWSAEGLDTCKDVAERLLEKFPDKLQIAPSTAANYTCKARNIKYGKPFSKAGGELGICEYIWCKRLSTGELDFLTDEEEEIKKRSLAKHFKTAEEKTALVQDLIQTKQLTQEEAWSYYSDILGVPGAYMGFIADMRSKGINIVKGTLVTRNGILYLEECGDLD